MPTRPYVLSADLQRPGNDEQQARSALALSTQRGLAAKGQLQILAHAHVRGLSRRQAKGPRVPVAQHGTCRTTWPGWAKETSCIVLSSSCRAPLGRTWKTGTLPARRGFGELNAGERHKASRET
jgi:hypothetical protein